MAIADAVEAEGSVSSLDATGRALMDVAASNGLIIEKDESIVRSPEARPAELPAERERHTRVH